MFFTLSTKAFLVYPLPFITYLAGALTSTVPKSTCSSTGNNLPLLSTILFSSSLIFFTVSLDVASVFSSLLLVSSALASKSSMTRVSALVLLLPKFTTPPSLSNFLASLLIPTNVLIRCPVSASICPNLTMLLVQSTTLESEVPSLTILDMSVRL